MITIGSLFSGIGGLELGLEWAGLGPTLWQVEQSAFCQEVLAMHWPEVRRFEDVRLVTADDLEPVDLICGGFPCQDVSSAGNRAGLAGKRSGLWREFARVILEMRPRWVVVENVASGAKLWVDAVVGWLVAHDYDALPLPVSAQACGAPHIRRRVFVIARAADCDCDCEHAKSEHEKMEAAQEHAADSNRDVVRIEQGRSSGTSRSGETESHHFGWWVAEPPVGRVAHGISHRVDRLHVLGNAVVPQCAEVVGWVIRELEGYGV